MPHWASLLGSERSDEELAAARAETVRIFNLGDEPFTCDDCPAKRTCEFAFDAYNIGGDCLAEK